MPQSWTYGINLGHIWVPREAINNKVLRKGQNRWRKIVCLFVCLILNLGYIWKFTIFFLIFIFLGREEKMFQMIIFRSSFFCVCVWKFQNMSQKSPLDETLKKINSFFHCTMFYLLHTVYYHVVFFFTYFLFYFSNVIQKVCIFPVNFWAVTKKAPFSSSKYALLPTSTSFIYLFLLNYLSYIHISPLCFQVRFLHLPDNTISNMMLHLLYQYWL